MREKRATATSDHILGAAFHLLAEHPEQPFSHEAVAKAAGVGARTVYRYFPAQADLFEALWLQVRKQSGTVFPTAEAEIVPQIGVLFRAFDQNEKLVRAVMQSPAGARVRARGAAGPSIPVPSPRGTSRHGPTKSISSSRNRRSPARQISGSGPANECLRSRSRGRTPHLCRR